MNSDDQQKPSHHIEGYVGRQPTIKQLKGICECYILDRLVRKNATRKEILKILDENNVRLSYCGYTDKPEFNGAIVHYMDVDSPDSESSDDCNRFDASVSETSDDCHRFKASVSGSSQSSDDYNRFEASVSDCDLNEVCKVWDVVDIDSDPDETSWPSDIDVAREESVEML